MIRSATRCAFDRPCHSFICDFNPWLAVSVWLAIAPLVMGEVCLPVANHFSISARS